MKYSIASLDPPAITKNLLWRIVESKNFFSRILRPENILQKSLFRLMFWMTLIINIIQSHHPLLASGLNHSGLNGEIGISTSFYCENSFKQIPVLPPVALCRNITVNLGASGTVNINGPDVDGGSYDPDGVITNRVVTPNTFSCGQKGPNTVTLTVTDDEGLTSSCTATVTVVDRIPPITLCRNATIYLDISGNATLGITDINNGSSDNCPAGFFLYLSRTEFNCSDLAAPVPVTLTGTDGSGNSSSCVAMVTVLDTISPRIFTKPFNLVLDTAGTGTLLPENVDNGTFDNCGSVSLTVTPNTFSCSDIGSHTVILTASDQNGNTSSRSVTVTVSSTLNIKGISLNSCDLAPTLALFQADIEGGNEDYTYFWKGLDETKRPFMVINPWPPSVHFYNTSDLETPYFNNNIPAGFYDIRLIVTDGYGCSDTSDFVINKTGPVYNNETYRKSEACEGEIRSYTVNYKPEATYAWTVVNGTILSSDQDTCTINVRWDMGVPDGIVRATITKANSIFPGGECEATIIDTVTVFPVPSPVFNNPVTDVCTNTQNTYTLTGTYSSYLWTVTGGVITGGGTGSDNFVSVLWGSGPSGNITVSAGNNQLCYGSVSLDITISSLRGAITALTNVTCNGNADGTVTAEAEAGTGVSPYDYSLDGGGWQLSGSFSSIAPGNHTVRVRDALLCISELPFIISQPTPVYGSIVNITDVSCLGGTNGSATISAAGGVPPYQYSLNGGALQGSNVFNNLSAGQYTVTIQDNNGCQGTLDFTVTQPLTVLAGSVMVTNVNCYGESTGSINLEVTGGAPPYSYLWNNGMTTQDISNIPEGNYSVIITDSRNCTLTVNAVITQPAAALSGTATVINVLCFGESTGSVNLTPAGGASPYTFLWSNGETTEDISDLSSGIYSVTITDSNGCTALIAASVSQPATPVSGSVISQTNVSCHGGSDGITTVSGVGGTPPYQYNIDGGAYQSSGTFSGLSAGDHLVAVRDNNLCIYVLTVTIAEPVSALGGSIISLTDVACYGQNTGSATASGSGGTSPYTYSIDGGIFQSSGLFQNLGAGTHTITVRDFKLCLYDIIFTVNQPSLPLSVTLNKTDVICRGGSTGTAEAFPSGGTPPYTYSWNTLPVQTGSVATGLAAGTYSVTVTDNNGCKVTSNIIIIEPPVSMIANAAVTNVDCFGESTGEINLTILNGTAPITYEWSNGSTDEDLTGLSAGSYSVTATDGNSCTVTAVFNVSQPPVLFGNIQVTNVGCRGGSNGSANLVVTGGVAPYSFLWSTGQTTEDISNLIAGDYSVTITDAHNCTLILNCTVAEPAAALGGSIVTQSDVTEYGGSDGSVTVAGSGGTPPYQYRVDAGAYQSSGTFSSLAAGIHTVTIRDAGLCTFDIIVTISQPSIPLTAILVSQTNVLCHGGNTGSISVTGWGGTSPYEYSIDGINFQASGSFVSLSAGPDTIVVRDAILNLYELPFVISEPDSLSFVITKTDVLCRNGSNGTATADVSGGTGPYTYVWNTDPVQNSATATGLAAGIYSVSVTDSNGCNTAGNVVIIQPNDDLSVTISAVDVLCAGGASGRATAVGFGGTGPYSYLWNSIPEQTTPTASGLPAGTYSVTVTDINGCTTSGSATINEPEPIELDYSITIASCPDSDDGAIAVTVEGGTGPYTFLWSDGAVTQNRTKVKPGNYSLIVTDMNSCSKALDAEVIFTGSFACVEIPNIITPNNDGYNDTWILKNIDLYPDAEIFVYNRWGKLVFRTKNISANPWDGRSGGKLVPTDSYHYILYLNDGSGPKSGVISVIR